MDIFGYEAQYIVRVHFIKKRTKWKHEGWNSNNVLL